MATRRSWIRKEQLKRLANHHEPELVQLLRQYDELAKRAASGLVSHVEFVSDDLRCKLSERIFRFYQRRDVSAFDWQLERGERKTRSDNIAALAALTAQAARSALADAPHDAAALADVPMVDASVHADQEMTGTS